MIYFEMFRDFLAIVGAMALVVIAGLIYCVLHDAVDPCLQADMDKENLIKKLNKRRAY